MTNVDKLLSAGYEDFITLDAPDFDAAIVGITHDQKLVYDYTKMIDVMKNEHGLSYGEAAEFIDYNTLRALPYAGDKAPVVMTTLEGL